jgi:hypothetical protein
MQVAAAAACSAADEAPSFDLQFVHGTETRLHEPTQGTGAHTLTSLATESDTNTLHCRHWQRRTWPMATPAAPSHRRLAALRSALVASCSGEERGGSAPTLVEQATALASASSAQELLEPVQTAAEVVDRVRRVGFCVLADVVPPDAVERVAASIIAAVHSPAQETAEREWEATRARGHRIGTPGVRSLKQLLRVTQDHAPYLADPRLIAAAEALFGGDGDGSASGERAASHPTFIRASCNDANVCMQGNSRGYWHADWPYNSTNATHIPPPYPVGGSAAAPLLHLTTIFMFSDFDEHRGGTLVLCVRSHQSEYPILYARFCCAAVSGTQAGPR